MLRYIRKLQNALLDTEIVGKSNSVSDIVRKIYKELMEGKKEYNRIPDTASAVAQCLLTFQNSHKPDDLWHLVTPDYKKDNIWIQLKSGDNKDMEKVIHAVDLFFQNSPPPLSLKHGWFGLTYINVVWQNKMVNGMLNAFLGSFLVVFIMMTILFRSSLWGILSMIPLTITIALIYGVIGLVGKDYDMPVAVLSSLTLGLAVDFAIHFLARSRETLLQYGSWEKTLDPMFGEPARAITRNIIVIAIGFLPLLAAPLVPYKTVGFFMASILVVSGIGTLLILPALMRVLEKWLFRVSEPQTMTCNCVMCIVVSLSTVMLIAISIHQYALVHWTVLTWLAVVLIPVMVLICGVMSRRKACRVTEGKKNSEKENQ